MVKKKNHPADEILQKLLNDCDELVGISKKDMLSNAVRKRLEENVEQLIEKLVNYIQSIHPVRNPTFVFDASNPDIIGKFVALALVAQPRIPLAEVDRFYGSGVYALYYEGDFPDYIPISGTETPIYVGKADPGSDKARNPREQGEKLSGRLKEHKRTILKASTTIKIEEFYYRSLVVQSGWQQAAESFLIHLFSPIWNNETNICYGFGKHGDDPSTRKNLRSPWDTIHPGRDWAYRDPEIQDAVPLEDLKARIAEHFKKRRIYYSLEDIFRTFVDSLRQQI